MLEVCHECFLHFGGDSLRFEVIESVGLTFLQLMYNGGFNVDVFHRIHPFSLGCHPFRTLKTFSLTEVCSYISNRRKTEQQKYQEIAVIFP